MQIVIDIQDDVIESAKSSPNYYPTYHFEKIWKAITNGTPLPKGHGNLCDENQIVGSLVWGGFLKDNIKCGDIARVLDMATIIEADKAESEEKE